MAVAITAIILEIIEGRPKPSEACRIYANEIKVQKTAGANVMMYCFFSLMRYAVAVKRTIVDTINWDHAKYLQIKLKSINVNPNDTKNSGTAIFNLELIFS